jgi:hypothetical protein
MAYRKSSSHHLLITIICLVIALGFLTFVAISVSEGSGAIETRASHDTFLTQSDDPLSLEQDLNKLGSDPGSNVEQQLNSAQ